MTSDPVHGGEVSLFMIHLNMIGNLHVIVGVIWSMPNVGFKNHCTDSDYPNIEYFKRISILLKKNEYEKYSRRHNYLSAHRD